MRSFDWSQTPLGPVTGWPQSLKTAVRIILTSRYAMFVWWGDELVNLYNDRLPRFPWQKASRRPRAVCANGVGRNLGPNWSPYRCGFASGRGDLRRSSPAADGTVSIIWKKPISLFLTVPSRTIKARFEASSARLPKKPSESSKRVAWLCFARSRPRLANVALQRRSAALRHGCMASADLDLPFALLYLADSSGRSLRLAARDGN